MDMLRTYPDFYINNTDLVNRNRNRNRKQHTEQTSQPLQSPPGADIQVLRSPRTKTSRHFHKPLPATLSAQPPLPSSNQLSTTLPAGAAFDDDLPVSPPALPPPSKNAFRETHMLSTPLPDYKHAANQTQKSRAAALEAAKASRVRKASHSQSAERERKNAATLARSGSVSSTSATNSSGLTAVTTRRSTEKDDYLARPFTKRNGRRYLRDPSSIYPLPVDLAEIQRQTLRTMLLCQVFGGPTCSPAFFTTPPKRVLEVGCGTGFWSVRCHRYFSQRGFGNVQFTGMDIAPLAQRMDDGDMNWRFVQHCVKNLPLPFRDEEFGLVMVKDMSLVTMGSQELMDEYLRILKPGGTLEFWDGDHILRALLQHSKPTHEQEENMQAPGTYTIAPQTPFAIPTNAYLIEYNSWISRALEKRGLNPIPTTSITPTLLQEPELTEVDSKRLAIPLGEVRWEREGVGGVIKGKAPSTSTSSHRPSPTSSAQQALRRTALMTVVQMIESLEPVLKEESEKGQNEWDRWLGGLMSDLLKGGGCAWGECLEVGAWWARKKGV